MDHSRPVARRRRAIAVALLAVAALLGACADAGDDPRVGQDTLGADDAVAVPGLGTATAGSSAPTSAGVETDGGAGTATIDELAAPTNVACMVGATVPVAVTYRTSGASRVALLVDGTQQPGDLAPDGRVDARLPCDGRGHTVVLVAVDAAGRTTLRSVAMVTGG